MAAEQADEPSDIYWENQHLTFLKALKRALISNIITIVIMGMCCGIIVALKVEKEMLGTEW